MQQKNNELLNDLSQAGDITDEIGARLEEAVKKFKEENYKVVSED